MTAVTNAFHSRESALLQALSLLPNSPPDCLVIHPFQSASVWGVSPSADGDDGLCPSTPPAFLRKRLERKPFLDFPLIIKQNSEREIKTFYRNKFRPPDFQGLTAPHDVEGALPRPGGLYNLSIALGRIFWYNIYLTAWRMPLCPIMKGHCAARPYKDPCLNNSGSLKGTLKNVGI